MDFLAAVVVLLAVLLGTPLVVAWILFARTRRLRAHVRELEERLRTIERQLEREPASESHAVEATAPLAAEVATEPAAAVTIPLAPPAPPVAEPLPQPPSTSAESLESRIGGRWLLNIGIAAIVIGVAYFEKLAIDNAWIGETARVIQGGVLGAALIFAGARFARRGYALYGQMLAGGGVAILYVSTYAAFNYYHLIDRPAAFALMVAVTTIGAVLANRHASQGLAVLAIGGGFATPFLLPGRTDAQIALFTYVAIMIGGTVFLARRRNWPLLHVVSYVLTLLTVAAWADRFYAPSKYLTTELYLTLFCAMFIAIAWAGRRVESGIGQFAMWLVWTAPLAYYFASLAILADHPLPLLIWLIAVALLGGMLSVKAGAGAGFLLWSTAALPLLAWTQPHAAAEWLTPGLAAVAALYAIGLAAQLREAGSNRALRPSEIAWLHVNALLMFAAAYFLLETTHLAVTGPLAAAFAIWQALLAAAFWTRDRERGIHFAALACTLLAIAIALQFDGPAVTVGWAAEGAAVIALGLIERRDWLRFGGTVLFVIAILRTLDLLMSPAPASYVVVANPRAACALLVVGLCYALAWLHRREAAAPAYAAAVACCVVAAQIVSLVFLTREIHAYFAVHGGGFTRELMVSVTWAIYATVLIVVGLQRQYAIVRYFAIAVFGVTILKVFLGDLAQLERIYRVMSVIGLGIALLLTSYLYQRMRNQVH